MFLRVLAHSCKHQMDEIINRFLLAGDTFMPETYLRQPIFAYSVCGPFTKTNK